SLESFIQTISAASSEFGVPPEAAGGHADETETSLILALRPDLVHMERAVAGYVGSKESIASMLFARGMPALSPIGVLGDPCSATAEKGQAYLRKLVDHLVEVIRPQLI
ncbi:MAG: creatininase family protein, partial [Chloroflexi bacterium]|nr:creatininase family protein [Chloroflexota bacterium]